MPTLCPQCHGRNLNEPVEPSSTNNRVTVTEQAYGWKLTWFDNGSAKNICICHCSHRQDALIAAAIEGRITVYHEATGMRGRYWFAEWSAPEEPRGRPPWGAKVYECEAVPRR
jgi:hypothetical protein